MSASLMLRYAAVDESDTKSVAVSLPCVIERCNERNDHAVIEPEIQQQRTC